jgi:hypothetical protein
LALIEAMRPIIRAAQPITGRGVGYKLFVRKLIPSMKTGEMQKVYRLLKEAREQDLIPWDWIVDESRELEKTASWDDPDEFTRSMINTYRREYWNQQPVRVEVWSEKGTCCGRCSTSTASASGRCTASVAPRVSMMSPRMLMAAN